MLLANSKARYISLRRNCEVRGNILGIPTGNIFLHSQHYMKQHLFGWMGINFECEMTLTSSCA